jgi:hypothetical protein
MFLAGIWHGSGLNYLVFGIIHGLYLCINHGWRVLFPLNKRNKTPKYPWLITLWQAVLTILAVLVGAIFFRATSVENALSLLNAMTINGNTIHNHPIDIGFVETFLSAFKYSLTKSLMPTLEVWHAGNLFTILLAFIFVWSTPNVLQIFAKQGASLSKSRAKPAKFNLEWHPSIAWGLMLGLLTTLSILEITGTSEFLYFQF